MSLLKLHYMKMMQIESSDWYRQTPLTPFTYNAGKLLEIVSMNGSRLLKDWSLA